MTKLLQLGEYITTLYAERRSPFGLIAKAFENIQNSFTTLYRDISILDNRIGDLESRELTDITIRIAIPNEF